MLASRSEVTKLFVSNPDIVTRELCNRSFYFFLQEFWPCISSSKFSPNWHIKLLCDELQTLAERVALGLPKLHDLIINITPGTTKTITCSISFPVWCWSRWYWMRFITASYGSTLALESAEYSRDLVRSTRFKQVYPEIDIKSDKDTKGNFRVITKKVNPLTGKLETFLGGNRFSTSVGVATLTGFHGHFLILDDPINPTQATSEAEIAGANHWVSQTLSTRKVDKAVTPTILIMQRLHQLDPSGYILSKKKEKVKHICLPGEIITDGFAEKVRPIELVSRYTDGLMDPVRLPLTVLNEMREDLGQYGYSGQVGQHPVPPGGGMFKVDNFNVVTSMPAEVSLGQTIRYWDKAGTQDGGAYTAGVKMTQLAKLKKWIVEDVKRGQWGTEERERIIKATAEADGTAVKVYIEQEGGSGGKESAESTIRNLAGFAVYADRPTGDKVYRADPYSVQVNSGNVWLLHGDWNHEFIEEHRFFPVSTYKDQVDAASAAFNKLAGKRQAGPVL